MSRNYIGLGGANCVSAATAATMAWCNTRGHLSGHSVRLSMNDLYSGLFRLRDTISREMPGRERPPRDCRLSVTSKPSLLLLQAIRCTHPACPCECFAPGKQSLRYCETCSHGWVAHALDKLGTNHVMNLGLQVEVVQPNIVFDIASLMLYGAHATPVRLKILLDRLFSVLQHEEVLQVLHGFGWTYEDYARGYILQDSSGRVLDKWCVATRDEEMVVLQQFLRFGETKAIAQEIILQDTKDRHEVLVKQTSRAESDIKKFIERSNLSMQSYIKSYESTRQLFGARAVPFIPPGPRLLTTPLISPTYTPTRDARALTLPQTPTTSSTPLVTPPLNRLQVMQPFDARKEHTTAAISLSPAALEKTLARRSPLCESPKNLCTTPSTVSSAAASPSHQAPHQQQGLDEVDGSDPYMSGSDDEGEVLDYSNKDNPDSPSDPEKKNKQHMRKSTNPIKRQWTPSANFGSTFVGPNGKKRVLCTACNKTFCDKGALKIHYSAVHLKEMHKCTVDGCNMMFSSRRSRNRHSANPNPKLHMPQKRKDDLDQSDELDLSVSNGSGRITPVSSAVSITASVASPISVISSSVISSQVIPLIDPPRIIRPDSSFFIEMSAQFPFMAPPEKRIKLEEDQPTDLSKVSTTNASQSDEEPCDLRKKYDGERKLKIDLDDAEEIKKEEDADVEGFKNDPGVRGGNRRKNTAPTRCAQSGEDNDDKGDEGVENSSHVTNLSLEGSGAKNFPKIASLLWAGGVNVEQAQRADCHEPDTPDHKLWAANLSKDEDSQGEGRDSDGDDEDDDSDRDSCEESGDVMQDYPAEMYVDKDNPLKCKICGKIFQNSFTVKIHFKNVHLKLLHSCTVEGCGATFPSKRSRDRHSANINLHRKLLSGDSNNDEEMDAALKGNILAKLYGRDLVDNNPPADANGRKQPPFTPDQKLASNNNNEPIKPTASPISQNGHTSKPGSAGSEVLSASDAESLDMTEQETVLCTVCGDKFSTPLVLQEHIALSHPDHALITYDPVVLRKCVSPRRIRNRQKIRNGMITRKTSSL